MELVVLGSGTCVPNLKRSCSAYYIKADNVHILFDIGFGTLRRMLEAGIDYREIDYIFCSHTHLDHVGDLAPLLMAINHTPGFKRKKNLTIVGPPNFINFMRQLGETFGINAIASSTFQLTIKEMEEETIQFEDFKIQSMLMAHNRIANGYRLTQKKKTIAYTGDTQHCLQAVALLHDAALGILDCSFPDNQPVEGHLTPSLAAEIAQKAGCEKIILSHFYPMMEKIDIIQICKKIYNGDINIAEDLEKYKI
ncbi:ribonuclease Z [candidate division KSB1 bacterium]|nr:ribonuclease Z [candidate division KSB1 bacterium]